MKTIFKIEQQQKLCFLKHFELFFEVTRRKDVRSLFQNLPKHHQIRKLYTKLVSVRDSCYKTVNVTAIMMK